MAVGIIIGAALTTVVKSLVDDIINLVQSAGVSGSIPNPNGEDPDVSGDFRGQGIISDEAFEAKKGQLLGL